MYCNFLGAGTPYCVQDNSCIAFDLSKLDLKGFEGGCYDEADKPSVTVAVSSTWRCHGTSAVQAPT